MPELTQTISCPLPGFEGVTVSFDLMTTPEQIDNFIQRMGRVSSHKGIVVSVEGWPQDEFGPDPWDGKRVPGVWFAWVSRKGWATAMKAYLDDPN